MKKALPTLILVLVLFAGFFYAKNQNYFREKTDTTPKTLATVKSGDVVGMKWIGKDPVELKKNGDTWVMVKPDDYPVQSVSADSVAGSLAEVTYKEKIDDNPSDLSIYGLDHPRQEIEADLKDGTKLVYQIGNPLPVPGTTYVKLAQSPAVYEVEDTSLTGIRKGAVDFFDKSVFAFDYDKVKSVELEWKNAKWTLTKSDLTKKAYESNWKLGDKELKPEDGSGILDSFKYLVADELANASTIGSVDGGELKLTLTEDNGGKDNVTIYKGKIDKDRLHIVKDGGKWAYTLSPSQIQEIFDKGKK